MRGSSAFFRLRLGLHGASPKDIRGGLSYTSHVLYFNGSLRFPLSPPGLGDSLAEQVDTWLAQASQLITSIQQNSDLFAPCYGNTSFKSRRIRKSVAMAMGWAMFLNRIREAAISKPGGYSA